MGERELREKYGGKLPKAINRAIRAEIKGGNEAIDRLTQLAAEAKNSHWHDKKGLPTPEAEAYHKHQRTVIEKMTAQVCQKWGVVAREESRAPAGRFSPIEPIDLSAITPPSAPPSQREGRSGNLSILGRHRR